MATVKMTATRALRRPPTPPPPARPLPPNSRHVKSHGIIGLGKDGGTELHGWLLDGSWGKLPGLLGGFAGAPGWQLEVVSGRAAGGGRARVWPQM